jgi:nucleoid-associated protein YgaU
MQLNRFGRILGVGTRVAAEKLRDGTAGAVAAVQQSRSAAQQQAAAGAQAAAPSQPKPAAAARSVSPGPSVPSSDVVAEGGRRLARGAGRFGASLWLPLAHVTGLLVLQITGVFFALFTFVFAVHSWQLYRNAGWRDHHLPMYLGFAVLFAWFAISSFWRANRRQKR